MASISTIHSDQAKIHNENGPDSTALAKNSSSPRPKLSSSVRHVHFPEDDSIILGCLEPFYPTPDNCTSDELIAAYIASCKIYKASPVDFLLEQLRGIDLSICNERYSRLCLRGIRLNRYQVETLEEIFRRVHFQEVDLEDTFLDEPSATALFDMMLHYETCVDLSISLSLERSTSSVAWSRCVAYLRKSAALRRFKLSHTPLTANLFNSLSFSGLSLQSLTFRDCSLTGPPLHYLLRLLRSLMNYTASSTTPATSKGFSHSGSNANRYPRLSYRGPMAPVPWALILRLPENRINALDAETLLLLVRHQLVMLPGPPTPLTPSDGKVDVKAISVPTNKPAGGSGYLEELDLSHNSLRDDGVQILCAGLLQAYQLQYRRLEVALKAIAQVTNPNSDPTSAANITIDIANLPPKCALPRARGLQRLNLADNALGNGGGFGGAGRHLAAVLRCSTERLAPLLGGLTFLDLSDNPGLGDGGVVELCEGLIRNFTLKELHLRNVRMRFDGAFALSGYIGETRSLFSLDIRQNAIDLAGLMAITRTLKVNRSLHSLQLGSQSSSSYTAEENEMRQIFLKEVSEYLRRNRNIKLQPEADILPEAGDENEPFSLNIQRTVERVPSLSIPDNMNNRETEEEIKKILLDPPRPPGYMSSCGSVDLDDVSTNMPPVENGTQFVIESQDQSIQLEYAVRTGPLTPDKVDIPNTLKSDKLEPEMTVEEIPEKEFSIDIPTSDSKKVEITVEGVQPEVHNLTEESFLESKKRKLDLQEPTLSGEISLSLSEEATFQSLGDEPPVEFEAFLKDYCETTAETADIPTLEKVKGHQREFGYPLDLSSVIEADKPSISPHVDFEPIISQTHDAPVLYSAPDHMEHTSSLQSQVLNPSRQTADESETSSTPFDDLKSKKEIFGENSSGIALTSRIEVVDVPSAKELNETDAEYKILEPQFKQSEELSRPERMIFDKLNVTSENSIGNLKGRIDFGEPQLDTEVKIFADPEPTRLKSPKETYVTPDSNTLPVMTTKQEMSSSEDLLKEAMQQYRNADMTLDHEEPVSAPSEDFIRREMEISESDDSLFNSSGHSPPKPSTEGVKVAPELEEHAEEELPAESFGRAEACWGVIKWDSGGPENSVSKMKQIQKPEKQPSQVDGTRSDRRVHEIVEHFDEENDTDFSLEQEYSSEVPVKELKQVGIYLSENTVDTLKGDEIKGENEVMLDKKVNEPASLRVLKVPDESSIEHGALDDYDAFSFRVPSDKVEGSNVQLSSFLKCEFGISESKASEDIPKVDFKIDELVLQDAVELEEVESHVERVVESRLSVDDEFRASSIGDEVTEKSIESRCETMIEKKSHTDGSESGGIVQLGVSTLQDMLESELASKFEATKDTNEIHELAADETRAVGVSDIFPRSKVLRAPDWTAEGEVLVFGVLNEGVKNVEEKLNRSSEDFNLEREDHYLASFDESDYAKENTYEITKPSISEAFKFEPTDHLKVVNACPINDGMTDDKQDENRPEKADFESPSAPSLDYSKTTNTNPTSGPLGSSKSTDLEIKKGNTIEVQNVKKVSEEIGQPGNNEKELSIFKVVAEPRELRPIIKTIFDNLNEEEEFTQSGHTERSINIENVPEAGFRINELTLNCIDESYESNQSSVKASVISKHIAEMKEPGQREKEYWNVKNHDEATTLNALVGIESQELDPKTETKSLFLGSSEDFNLQSKSFGFGKETTYRDDSELRSGSAGDKDNPKILGDVRNPSKDIQVLAELNQWHTEDWKSEKCDEGATIEDAVSNFNTEKESPIEMNSEIFNAENKPDGVDQVTFSKQDIKPLPMVNFKSSIQLEAGEDGLGKPTHSQIASKSVPKSKEPDQWKIGDCNVEKLVESILKSSTGTESQALDLQFERKSPFALDDWSNKNKSTDLERVNVSEDDIKRRLAVGVKETKDWEADVLEEKNVEIPAEMFAGSKDGAGLEKLNLSFENDEGRNIEARKSLATMPNILGADFCADISRFDSNLEAKRSREESALTGFVGQPGSMEASYNPSTSPEITLELENPAFGSREVVAGFEADNLIEEKNSEFQEESAEMKLTPMTFGSEEVDSKVWSTADWYDEPQKARLSSKSENMKTFSFKEANPNSEELISDSEILGFAVNTFSMDNWNADKIIKLSGDLSIVHPEWESQSGVEITDSIVEGKELESRSLEKLDPKDIIPTSIHESGFDSKPNPPEWKVDDWRELKVSARSDAVEVSSRTPEAPHHAGPSEGKTPSNMSEQPQEPSTKPEDWEAWADFRD